MNLAVFAIDAGVEIFYPGADSPLLDEVGETGTSSFLQQAFEQMLEGGQGGSAYDTQPPVCY